VPEVELRDSALDDLLELARVCSVPQPADSVRHDSELVLHD
jgi:hypothetical protein